MGQNGICQKADEEDANEVLVSVCLDLGTFSLEIVLNLAVHYSRSLTSLDTTQFTACGNHG